MALDVLQSATEFGDDPNYDDSVLSLDLYQSLLEYVDGLREQAAIAKEQAKGQAEVQETPRDLLGQGNRSENIGKSMDGLSVQLPLELAMVGKVVQLRSARAVQNAQQGAICEHPLRAGYRFEAGGGQVGLELMTTETIKSLHAALKLARSRDEGDEPVYGLQ